MLIVFYKLHFAVQKSVSKEWGTSGDLEMSVWVANRVYLRFLRHVPEPNRLMRHVSSFDAPIKSTGELSQVLRAWQRLKCFVSGPAGPISGHPISFTGDFPGASSPGQSTRTSLPLRQWLLGCIPEGTAIWGFCLNKFP